MHTSLLNELKTSLEQEHDVLIERLKSIASPNPDNKDDWNAKYPKFEPDENASHASTETEEDEVEEYEVRLEAEHSLESRLLEVKKALERIANSTYGMCAECGKAIPEDRLRANPAAEHDIEHEK